MSKYDIEIVQSVRHWTDRLFSFTCTRAPSLRFNNGEFTMVGLEVEDRPLVRAYSIVSPNYEEYLEFLSIKVHYGPLTSRLQHVNVGDSILIGKKPTGTLVVDNLLPGKTLWMLSSGTGLAPFMSIIRDLGIYERFEWVILTHTCRIKDELAYMDYIKKDLQNHEYLGDFIKNKFFYYPTLTREEFENKGRITDLIASGKLFNDLGFPKFSPENDRVMLCGSALMLKDATKLLKQSGLVEGKNNRPGHYVIERAFVD
ncbi:MAG: ferredoxin--NADP reductase [Burkholderia sp.]|nr:ferredoxin--NADP reductase [Burkholderia sp.]